MVARTSVAQAGLSSVARSLKIHQFIVGSAKNALAIARRFSNNLKSVDPKAHHRGRILTFRRKLYIGRGLRCAIYIILSLSIQASEYFFTHVCPFVPEFVSME